MDKKTIKTGIIYRNVTIERQDVDEEKRSVELSFSSEEPYERWWGTEILDHSSGAVMLDRLNKGGALLLDHNTRDQVGVVENAFVGADRKGRAVVRFGKSDHADEIFADVLDGIRQSVSVGYRIHKMKQEESDPDNPIYRATQWEPMEISLVSVPADISIGVGRSEADMKFETEIINREVNDMKPEDKKNEDGQVKIETREIKVADTEAIEKAGRDATKKEQLRVKEILAYGKQFNCMEKAAAAIDEGISIDDFKTQILEGMKGVKPVLTGEGPEIGLSDKENKQFSFVRLIRAIADGRPEDAAFERECSRAVEKQLGKSAQGFFVPFDVLKRDLNVTTDSQGGYLVATNLLTASFITMLRNRMMTVQLGAMTLTGLVGDVAIPKQTGGATAYWVTEGNAPTESQQAVGQVGLVPHTVGAYTDITRKLIKQSSIDVEAFVRADLAATLGLAIDVAGINGSGVSPYPEGILNTDGIGSVTGGTNGAAPDWADIVNLETEVSVDNADLGRLAYLTNAKVRGKLKQTLKNTNSPVFIWENDPQGRPGYGMLNGYVAGASNQVPSTLTKGSSSGVCSAIIFGNFGDLVYGFWGALDILVDPYSNSTSGTVRVVALQDVDTAIRHAESFAAMKDALTT